MITVVKHGNPKPLYEIVCQCGCEFTFEREDISYDKDRPYVVCPECNLFIATELSKQIERK